MMPRQNASPNSKNGIRAMRPVWINVSASKVSSSVPKPPGNTQIAEARNRKCILRIAK
jgi:hypothetical protein